MITARSFLIQKGQVISIDEAAGPLQDIDYVNGVIHVVFDEQSGLSFEMMDYVDQLWSYWLTCLEQVQATGSGEFWYPDTPIRVSIRRIDARPIVLARIEINQDEPTVHVAPWSEFAEAMTNEALHFATRLATIEPRLSTWARAEVDRAYQFLNRIRLSGVVSRP